jgi:hypothetical protein
MKTAEIRIEKIDSEITREGFSNGDKVIAEIDERGAAYFKSKNGTGDCILYRGDYSFVSEPVKKDPLADAAGYIKAEAQWLDRNNIPYEYQALGKTIRFPDLNAGQLFIISQHHKTDWAHGLLMHDRLLGLMIKFV